MKDYTDTIQIWPVWVQTVAKMRRHKVFVYSKCFKCETMLRMSDADLRAIENIHGPHFSLIDKCPSCKVLLPGTKPCPGKVFFMASSANDCRVIPLLTRSDRAPDKLDGGRDR